MDRLLKILDDMDLDLMELSKLFDDQKIKNKFVSLAFHHLCLKETLKEMKKNLSAALKKEY